MRRKGARNTGLEPARGLMRRNKWVRTSKVTTEKPVDPAFRARCSTGLLRAPRWTNLHRSPAAGSAGRDLNPCLARRYVVRAQGHRTPPHVLRRVIRRPLLWDEVIGI